MENNFRILKPFFRGWPLAVLAVLVSVMCAKKYLDYVTPMYESTARLKLADVNEGIPNSNLFRNFDVFASTSKITAEIEVLKSSCILDQALQNLGFSLEVYRVGDLHSVEMYTNTPIKIEGTFHSDKAYDRHYRLKVISGEDYLLFLPGASQPLKGAFGSPLPFAYGTFLISRNSCFLKSRPYAKIIDTYEFEFLSKQKLVEKINKNLDITSTDKDVPVIRINLKSNVPEKAAVFVNALAKAYIDDYIETKFRAANITVQFLNRQIRVASDKLSWAEDKIEEYRNSQSITNIIQETETDLRKISQMKIQLTNITMSLRAIEALNKYVSSGKDNFLSLAPNFEAFNDLLSTEMVKNIKKLQADKKDLLLVYTKNDERVKVIDEKIKDLTAYLVESINNTRKDLTIKYQELNSAIEAAEKVFADVPEKEKMLTILTRDFDLLQHSYNFLNEKKIEAEIAQSARIAFHRIITPAEISKIPVSPNRTIILCMAALLGLLGSITLIYTVHGVKARVNDLYTIHNNTALPVALSTPFSADERVLEKHFLREAALMPVKIKFSDHPVLAINSSSLGEGRSFHAIGLAKAFGRQGKRVLLLDAAGNLPCKAKQPAADKKNVLTIFENVYYQAMPASEFMNYSKEKVKAYMADLRGGFDMVIINNEPLEDANTGLLLMNASDINLFVLDSRKTSVKQIAAIDQVHEELGIANSWLILNRAGYQPSVLKQLTGLLRLAKNALFKSNRNKQ